MKELSSETRADFQTITESVDRSNIVWGFLALGLVSAGVLATFFDGQFIKEVAAIESAMSVWQFVEGRIQEAKVGNINRRGEIRIDAYGSFKHFYPRRKITRKIG